FRDRDCYVVFVSMNTKYSLSFWRNTPTRYGGLGQVDIPLLSDCNFTLSRDYGVFEEKERICLRSSILIDEQMIV
ncbi:hypothetical protein BU23DRAFT_468875, partial [Bimuria novae-zelandiae CBS 107.79]